MARPRILWAVLAINAAMATIQIGAGLAGRTIEAIGLAALGRERGYRCAAVLASLWRWWFFLAVGTTRPDTIGRSRQGQTAVRAETDAACNTLEIGMARISTFAKDLQLATAGISPEAIAPALAAFARAELANAIQSGEASERYDRYVNGRQGAAEESVVVPGRIPGP